MLRDGNLPYERVLCSNDWFTIDKEGYLYFLGRTDDIIKTRGEKVSPVEIENIIYKMPELRSSCYGVPDEILGESIIAFLTLHKGFSLVKKLFKKPVWQKWKCHGSKTVVILEEMPKNINRKIDKKMLKKKYLEHE